jgi:hypothetical protein
MREAFLRGGRDRAMPGTLHQMPAHIKRGGRAAAGAPR